MYIATFSLQGKIIHTCEKEDMYELPKSKTEHEINDISYFIEGFTILGNRVIYSIRLT